MAIGGDVQVRVSMLLAGAGKPVAFVRLHSSDTFSVLVKRVEELVASRTGRPGLTWPRDLALYDEGSHPARALQASEGALPLQALGFFPGGSVRVELAASTAAAEANQAAVADTAAGRQQATGKRPAPTLVSAEMLASHLDRFKNDPILAAAVRVGTVACFARNLSAPGTPQQHKKLLLYSRELTSLRCAYMYDGLYAQPRFNVMGSSSLPVLSSGAVSSKVRDAIAKAARADAKAAAKAATKAAASSSPGASPHSSLASSAATPSAWGSAPVASSAHCGLLRRMLMKQHSVGRDGLDQEERFHVEIVVAASRDGEDRRECGGTRTTADGDSGAAPDRKLGDDDKEDDGARSYFHFWPRNWTLGHGLDDAQVRL